MKKYYITTSIFYASGRPHIGNISEAIIADAIARFYKLLGYDVYFQTGTDEHGQKIEQKAIEADLEPQEYVDKISKQVIEEIDSVNISYDSFGRTTNLNHQNERLFACRCP